MARGRCRGGGADHWSDKRYSHLLEFSETCLQCRGILFIIFWWLGGNPALLRPMYMDTDVWWCQSDYVWLLMMLNTKLDEIMRRKTSVRSRARINAGSRSFDTCTCISLLHCLYQVGQKKLHTVFIAITLSTPVLSINLHNFWHIYTIGNLHLDDA